MAEARCKEVAEDICARVNVFASPVADLTRGNVVSLACLCAVETLEDPCKPGADREAAVNRAVDSDDIATGGVSLAGLGKVLHARFVLAVEDAWAEVTKAALEDTSLVD